MFGFLLYKSLFWVYDNSCIPNLTMNQLQEDETHEENSRSASCPLPDRRLHQRLRRRYPRGTGQIGYITIGDENEGYSANHLNGLKEAQAALGISDDQVLCKYNVPETEDAYEAAIDLAEQGCNIIFATSFGHESYVFQAAAEYPNIQFCQATGNSAMNSELTNVHNYFYAVVKRM